MAGVSSKPDGKSGYLHNGIQVANAPRVTEPQEAGYSYHIPQAESNE